MTLTVPELAAQLYDASVPDWPGEIEFYQELAAAAREKDQPVLEVACGTGRVAIRLAQTGVRVVGVDLSRAMLDVAREKSAAIPDLLWVEGDMRTFELGQQFGLVIMPGHVFQHMLTPQDQIACLENLQRHLAPGGRLVVHLDHQNVDWLGGLITGEGGVFQKGQIVTHPKTGHRFQTSYAWTYEPATQTAYLESVWEQIGPDGQVLERWERRPIGLHCVFRFEMQHLLERVGFMIEALYGDFTRGDLDDESSEMVWVVSSRF